MTVYRSAIVRDVPTNLLPPGCERVEGPRHKMPGMLRRAQQSGELTVVIPPMPIDQTRSVAYVMRYRAPANPWVRRGVVIGVVGVALTALGYAIVSMLNAARAALVEVTAPMLIGLLVIALILFGAALRARSGRTVTGTFTATIK